MISRFLFMAVGASLLVMFWNVENFYDYREGKQSKGHFYAKCEGIAKIVMKAGDSEGCLPDIIGLAEVENSFVVQQILRSTSLSKTDYKYVHYDSPDHRGIDCALLYRSSRLTLTDSRPCHILDSAGNVMATRDILLASFLDRDGKRVDVLVNHHPSKFGGKKGDGGRGAAMGRMIQIRDSLANSGGIFLSLGDFNEEPGDCPSSLKDLSVPLKEKGLGTIRYNGGWELIDRSFTDEGACAYMKIFSDSSLSVKDSSHSGEKPRRTSSGPRYLGGISDHYPILVHLFY